MCPGLTSKGGDLPKDLKEGQIVAVFAEGKQHALAIGIMKMSSDAIIKINKGVGVELVHFLGDCLWDLL